jgi:hypothetical protein
MCRKVVWKPAVFCSVSSAEETCVHHANTFRGRQDPQQNREAYRQINRTHANHTKCRKAFLLINIPFISIILWRVTPCRNCVSTVPCRREPKKAKESRREPTKAEESRSEPSQQKGGMFILCCSATVSYTRYAISTTIATVFGGVRSEELFWKPSAIQNQFVNSSREESEEVNSRSKISARVSECEAVKCVIIWDSNG